MVADEDRDSLARLQATLTPGVRQRIRPLVELLVAQLSALVDDRQPIAVAGGADREDATDHPVALE